MIKHLVSHGNSKALVIDKGILQAAGLNANTAFQIIVHANGLTIQNVNDEASTEEFTVIADKLMKSKSKLWKSLAKKMIKFLPVEMVILYHDKLIDEYGGLKGIRDMGLLLSAMEMPKSSMFGIDFHLTLFDKASAYLFHIVCNHPFNDGNKRIGGLSAVVFLKLNRININFDDELYEELIIQVAQGKMNKDKISQFFKDYSKIKHKKSKF